MDNNGFVPLENIFANDVLNSALAPEIGAEDTSLNITPFSGAFSDPFSIEIEPIATIESLEDNQSTNDDLSSSTTNNINTNQFIDPLTGNQVNNNTDNNDSFTNSSVKPRP